MNNQIIQVSKELAEQKAIAIIKSCVTISHFETARNYIYIFDNKYQDIVSYSKLWELWKNSLLNKINIGNLRKEIIGNELYLYNAKNELIFKRWLNQGKSVVFDLMTYDKHTLVSITEKGKTINK